MNVDYQVSDFGTMITRRVSRAPVEQGGWSAGIDMLNPAVQAQLRGNGSDSWIGWPNSPRIEQLRDQWFQAPTLEAQQEAARALQLQAFQDVPYLPVGQFSQLTAYSRTLSDVPRGYALFWNVKKDA